MRIQEPTVEKLRQGGGRSGAGMDSTYFMRLRVSGPKVGRHHSL